MMTFWTILLVVLVLLGLWVIGLYNRLVELKNRVNNAWSQIDVQLQRRYDLIPNLVETVKGYMAHERSTLEDVVNARNRASKAREEIREGGGPTEESLKKLIGAEQKLQSGLVNVFALAENYPELKASETMQQLQEELRTTENRVAFSRQSYNDQVFIYNTAQQQFPAVLLAGKFGHHEAELYEVEKKEAKQAVKVQSAIPAGDPWEA